MATEAAKAPLATAASGAGGAAARAPPATAAGAADDAAAKAPLATAASDAGDVATRAPLAMAAGAADDAAAKAPLSMAASDANDEAAVRLPMVVAKSARGDRAPSDLRRCHGLCRLRRGWDETPNVAMEVANAPLATAARDVGGVAASGQAVNGARDGAAARLPMAVETSEVRAAPCGGGVAMAAAHRRPPMAATSMAAANGWGCVWCRCHQKASAGPRPGGQAAARSAPLPSRRAAVPALMVAARAAGGVALRAAMTTDRCRGACGRGGGDGEALGGLMVDA